MIVDVFVLGLVVRQLGYRRVRDRLVPVTLTTIPVQNTGGCYRHHGQDNCGLEKKIMIFY